MPVLFIGDLLYNSFMSGFIRIYWMSLEFITFYSVLLRPFPIKFVCERRALENQY